jgi:hypothetical protein
MDRVLRTLLLAVVVGSVAWAVLRWPHLDTVETGRTPEYPDLVRATTSRRRRR